MDVILKSFNHVILKIAWSMIVLIHFPPNIPSTFQYTNYDYGEHYDYTEGELTTDAPPAEIPKTEVKSY